MKTRILLLGLIVTALLSLFGSSARFSAFAGATYAQDDWKDEFDATCTVQDSGGVPAGEELHLLIKRCDNLQARFEKLDDPHRKVMLSRLKRCRDYYAFLMDYSFLLDKKAKR